MNSIGTFVLLRKLALYSPQYYFHYLLALKIQEAIDGIEAGFHWLGEAIYTLCLFSSLLYIFVDVIIIIVIVVIIIMIIIIITIPP